MKRCLLLFLASLAFFVTFSQTLRPDPAFGENGMAETSLGSDLDLTNLVRQPDGKILAAGGAYVSRNDTMRWEVAVMRFNPDGSLDNSFGTGGKVTTFFPPDYRLPFVITNNVSASSIALQSDGKIVVTGTADEKGHYSGHAFAVVRYNPDGSLDNSFDGDGRAILENTGISIANTLITADHIYAVGSMLANDKNSGVAAFLYNATPVTCTAPTFLNNGMIVQSATCGRSDGELYVIPTSGTAPFQYSKDGGQTYVSGPNSGYTFSNLSAGTYLLRMKDASGCESEVVAKQVLSPDCPTTCTPPTFVNNGMIVGHASCGGSDGSLYLIPTSGTAPFLYSINGGATYVSGPDNGYTFTGLAPGTYQLSIKDATGCESAVVQKEVLALYGNCSGVAPKVKAPAEAVAGGQTRIAAYPNPSKGQFRVQLQGTTGKVQVQVLNAQGAVVEQRRVNVSEVGTLDFNLSQKAKGLYLVRVVSEKGTQITKVLIQ